MREILFRGKRVDNDEWVISDCFYQCDGEVKLWDNPNRDGWVAINPETIGQYTGINDINGTKIFEGDVVEITCKFKGKVEFENCGVVKYIENKFEAEIFTDDEDFTFPLFECKNNDEREDTFIVIGNIYDDPDLLKED